VELNFYTYNVAADQVSDANRFGNCHLLQNTSHIQKPTLLPLIILCHRAPLRHFAGSVPNTHSVGVQFETWLSW